MPTQKSTTPQAQANPEVSSKTMAGSSQKSLYPNLLTLDEMEDIEQRHMLASLARAKAKLDAAAAKAAE